MDASKVASALAQELREIAETLTTQKAEPHGLARALELARALRPHLAGPYRERWYDAEVLPPFGSDGSAFHDTSPMRGAVNPVAPPLTSAVETREDGTQVVVGHARLSRTYEGPPHGVHGGIVAGLFDEILGASQVLCPPPGVTAKLEVRYRHLTPIDEDLRFEAWIVSERGRRVEAHATCHAGETLTADARAWFVRIDFDEAEERMRARGDA